MGKVGTVPASELDSERAIELSGYMIIWKGSPNFIRGRGGYRPEAVVIHIMAGTLVGTDAHFANPASQVSAHYGIGKQGQIHQYVKEEDTAFHVGTVDRLTWAREFTSASIQTSNS